MTTKRHWCVWWVDKGGKLQTTCPCRYEVRYVDYMHEGLTECPHRPLCHDSWDPCLLAIQHPHAMGLNKFAGPFDACSKCTVAARP